MGLAAGKWKVEKTPLLGSLGIYAVPAWRHERPMIDSDPGYSENREETGIRLVPEHIAGNTLCKTNGARRCPMN